jgi:hypothetical protein
MPKPLRRYGPIFRWTPELKQRFIAHLARCGSVQAAVDACGLSRQSLYKLRGRDAEFARAWEAALAGLRAKLEGELAERFAALPRTSAAAVRFAELVDRVLRPSVQTATPSPEGAVSFSPGHRALDQLASTCGHFTQSKPICS